MENNFQPLRIDSEHSKIVQELKDKCTELTELAVGWDGYDAVPVSINRAKLAKKIIQELVKPNVPKPGITPGYNGNIQIEWCENNFELEIEITKHNEVEVLLTDLSTGDIEEISLNLSNNKNFYFLLAELVNKLRES